MFSQEDLFMLRRVADILDREEKLLAETKSKSMYKNLVVNADQELSHLVHHLEDHPELAHPYWHDELITAIENGSLHGIMEATVCKEEHGEYTLTLSDPDNDEMEMNFENYIDTDTVQEDIAQLIKQGYNIQLLTNLEEI